MGRTSQQYLAPLRLRLLLLVFIAVIPALGLILYGAAAERGHAAQEAQEQALRTARFAVDDYTRLIREGERLLAVLAQVPSVRTGGPVACSAFLAGLLKQDARYRNLGVIEADGRLCCSALPLSTDINLNDRAYFKRVMQTGRFAIGDFQIGHLTKRATLNLGYPVVDARGEVVRVVFSAIDLERFNEIAAGAGLPPHASLTVIDPRGTILARYPDSQKWLGQPAREAVVVQRVLTKQAEGSLETEGEGGETYFYAYAPLKIGAEAAGVYVGVSILKDAVVAHANHALARELGVFTVITLLVFVIAWFGADAFVLRGVRGLIGATRRLADGDLTARSGLAPVGGELGELARSFDAMAESLEQRETKLRRAQAERAHAEARFAGILGIAAEAIIAVDEEQRIVLFNQSAEQTFGYSAQEIIGQPLDRLLPERFAAAHGAHVRRFGAGAETARRMGQRRTVYGRRKDGKEFPAEVSISKLVQDGRVTYTAILRDITERKQAEDELRLLQTITLAVSATPDLPAAIGVVLQKVCEVTGWNVGQAWLPQPDNGRLVCCPAWQAADKGFESFRAASLETRFAPGQGLPGRVWSSKQPAWVPDVTRDGNFPRAPHAAAAGLRAGMAFPVLANDEVIVILEFFLREPRAEDRHLIDLVSAVANQLGAVIVRKRSEEQLRYLAHYDVLTGLPNRALLHDRLRQAMYEAARHHRIVGVAFLDLDRFKTINDSLGHEAGDVLLRAVAKRLSDCLRPDDTVARLSGDEFAVVFAGMEHADDAARVAQKILGAFTLPFPVGGQELFVTASIGLTLYPLDDSDVEGLLRNADVAMYRAKEAGRNNYQFYAPEMTAKSRERLSLENALRHALERGEFEVHYQPVVDLAARAVDGVEALVRWRHPERGLVSPADFIPLAEETGLIVPLGEWVLDQACRQVRAWRAQGLPRLTLAVNVSARQFRKKDLSETVAAVLARTGFDAADLELELTESLLAETEILATLNALSAQGIQLSIDDFGTGYSALSYLKRFPIDTLKIDRSFVSDIATDADTAALASAMIAMAHALEIRVIAEGVETEAQLRFLAEHGCDAVQGYYFSAPVPPAQLPERMHVAWPFPHAPAQGRRPITATKLHALRHGNPPRPRS